MTLGLWFPAVLRQIENWNQKSQVTGEGFFFIRLPVIIYSFFNCNIGWSDEISATVKYISPSYFYE